MVDGSGDYPIRTGRDGRRVYRRIRCDICDSTKVRCKHSEKQTAPSATPGAPDRLVCTLRYYQCQECYDLHGGTGAGKRRHTFQVTVV